MLHWDKITNHLQTYHTYLFVTTQIFSVFISFPVCMFSHPYLCQSVWKDSFRNVTLRTGIVTMITQCSLRVRLSRYVCWLHLAAETRCVGFSRLAPYPRPTLSASPPTPPCTAPCNPRCNSLSLTHCSTVNHAYRIVCWFKVMSMVYANIRAPFCCYLSFDLTYRPLVKS